MEVQVGVAEGSDAHTHYTIAGIRLQNKTQQSTRNGPDQALPRKLATDAKNIQQSIGVEVAVEADAQEALVAAGVMFCAWNAGS